MIDVMNCPLCGSEFLSRSGYAGTSPRIMSSIGPLKDIELAVLSKYKVCSYCGLVFQSPRLSKEMITEYYASGFYRKTLAATSDEQDQDELERAERILKYIKITTTGSLLDVGCSRGYLMQLAQDRRGYVVEGVDLNPSYGKTDFAVYDTLENIRGTFDVVTCIHTLEHVNDLSDFRYELISRVKVGGTLIIEVPSMKSPGSSFRLGHLYHFETYVLCRLFSVLTLKHVEQTPHNLVIFQKENNE